jgi:hypothetical protein
VAADFRYKERDGEDSHYWHGFHGLSDLHSNLVFQKFRVGKCGVVENKEIGEGGHYEVKSSAE